MPSGQQDDQEGNLSRYLGDSHDQTGSDVHLSVKEQAAQFERLSRELETERQTVVHQLSRCHLGDRTDKPVSGVETSYHWRTHPEAAAPEDTHLEAKMTDSHMRYYSDRGSEIIHHYIPYTDAYYSQEGIQPPTQETYGVGYQPTATPTNGHHGDGNISPTSSQLSVPGENATLINRTTPQPKTQQPMKTVPKIIPPRHIGPEGQAVEYPPYSAAPPLPPSTSSGYGTYGYTVPANVPHDYNTYNSGVGGQPPPPPPQGIYPPDYSTYGRTTSPSARPNFEVYPPRIGQTFPDYDYHGYPAQPPSPPSASSESPQPRRAMPQVPRSGETEYNHRPAGYDELDPTLVPSRPEYQERFPSTPSPGPVSDRFGPYGYSGTQIPATSPGYAPYEAPPPQGYLDRRPSYDDHPQSQVPHIRPPTSYTHPSRVAEENAGLPLPTMDRQYPPPPRHPHLENESIDGEGRDVRWRDPDLHEVIEFLGHPNNVVRANAAAYLQHLCYMDDNIKQKTRVLGGIPQLVDLLNQEIPEIQRNACGALRNLSFGRQNEENKRAIRNAGGIPTLVQLLRKTPDNEIRELVTGILWNLSSSEELKKPIIDDALTVLVNHVIIPHSGWDRNRDPSDQIKTQEIYWSTVFRNASGVLRNVSSAGEYARKKLRECEGLVDSLLHIVRAAIGKNDMDNKSVENCVCILRNLSYRCQEVEDPDYDKHIISPPQTRAMVPINKVGENLGCFGTSKKKKEAQSAEKQKRDGIVTSGSSRPRSEPVKGMDLLWQPEVVQPYLALLSECSNPETLEAAAGGIQNLAACYWQPSIDIRAAVRKEKGLPILVELLRMEVDRVVCAVATALRNLAMDQRNKELIGKYAIRDLVQKLPPGNPQHDAGTSDDTIAAVLATLNEVIVKNSDFSRSLLEWGGVERLTYITKQKGKFSSRVVKFTSQLLFNMWQHQELREVYKKAGWKEGHFITRTMIARITASPPASANNTLSRPISTQGGTNYEDRTLSRGRELNTVAPGQVPYSRSEELAMNDLAHMPEPPQSQTQPQLQPPQPQPQPQPQSQPQMQSQTIKPPVGGVPIFPPTLPHHEPLYAQVNRDKKKRHPDMSSQPLLLDHQVDAQGGDSWV
ncbi:catenin delta-2-like isoform X2 [Centruroides vittatus]|uniref:catenin delta-2-like isoform X2 n=1 Tax=Centruroides vittatus TaxID=120091 RepID=UPI00350F4D1B